ncbi:hypothetical protein PRIPAC_78416, partial [Pristionchus pacificus]|uniref:Uncharacterized protein n=1 Tax=Pristionchus pacificus TaxID=54126 RepID=A0A2A6BY79_PRIPA
SLRLAGFDVTKGEGKPLRRHRPLPHASKKDGFPSPPLVVTRCHGERATPVFLPPLFLSPPPIPSMRDSLNKSPSPALLHSLFFLSLLALEVSLDYFVLAKPSCALIVFESPSEGGMPFRVPFSYGPDRDSMG